MLDFIKDKIIEIVLGFLLILLLVVEANTIGDLDIFISASKDLLKGNNIYIIKYREWFHYYYDVFFALIISPLQFIPLYWANLLWSLLNVALTYRIWIIIKSYLPYNMLSKSQRRLFTTISFVFIFALWFKNIHLTQLTILILFLCLEGIYQIENKKPLYGSLFIAVGISIKILPIVLIPYLLYRGQFKPVIFSLLFVIVLLFLPAIFIGFDYNIILLQERWTLINPLNNAHIIDVSERSFHSLTSFLSVLLVEDAGNAYSLDLKRNIANLSMDNLKLIINAVRLAFILGTLFFINSFPFKASKNRLQSFYELSYIMLIIPLIFPHQQHYAFLLVFPAISYLVFYFIIKYFYDENKKRTIKIIALGIYFLLIYFLLNSHFILGEYNAFYDHYKTLTYGVFLLIPLLAIARPDKMLLLIERNKTKIHKAAKKSDL